MNTQTPFLPIISDRNRIVTALNDCLLKTYLVDAEISLCSDCRLPPSVYAPISTIENYGLIAFSAPAVNRLINITLGATNADSASVEPTATTLIALQKISQTMCYALGAIVCGNFSTLCPQNFNPVAAICLKLAPDAPFWLQLPVSEKQIITENLPIELTAVIQQAFLPINQIAEWKVGSLLPLGIEKNAEISILHQNKTVFKGIMGQKSQHIAVKITQKVSENEQF